LQAKPLLLIDIDGVISLFAPGLDALDTSGGAFGFGTSCTGRFALIDGITHFLSVTAGGHLLELSRRFDPVWCSGWEEKADEYLPHLLELGESWPHLCFERSPGRSRAHWKLDAIDTHAGARPLAWIDDALDEECRRWATDREARGSATLLVGTDPRVGLERRHVDELLAWAEGIGRGRGH
jgi:hypothetical protein